ncbi:MAG: transcriptional regulator [Spirochaetaceae bacterium]|mgnify:CR=1 FL=1|nr:transcriptional regulator [Spirochaetaceae bacterium]|tara:strand:- start:23324 stop:24241 length:918 start_codon:yes stop_codon:yes gene_type:complete
MTLTQLRYVLSLARHGSFGKAAEHSLVAQPTLSIQIQKLEQELGVEIFDRKRSPIALTEPGKKVEAYARRILDEADALLEEFQDNSEELRGRIRLGIIPTVSSYLLPKIFRKLKQKYPEAEFYIHELPTSEILRKVQNEQLDIGILATPLNERMIEEIPLYYEPFVVYFPPDAKVPTGRLSLDDLQGTDMLLLGEEHCFRHQSLKLCGQGNAGKIECGSLDTIKKMVDQGMGATLLPLLSANLKSERVVRFKNPEPVREIGMIHGRSFYKSRMLKALKDTILANIPEDLHQQKNRKLIGAEDVLG